MLTQLYERRKSISESFDESRLSELLLSFAISLKNKEEKD